MQGLKNIKRYSVKSTNSLCALKNARIGLFAGYGSQALALEKLRY